MNKWVRSNPILRLPVELIKGRVRNGPAFFLFQDAFVHLGPIPIMQYFFRNSIVLDRVVTI